MTNNLKRDFPGTWGRYTLDSLLGTGGMGDVYKAYDPTLKRYVALKILRHEDPEVVQRFLREARSQAQVENRNVCKIYESGEYEGHPYIAMQYIEGQTLLELSGKLKLEDTLKIMKKVALGLHAAHTQGLIHRDVKPANIMVKQTDDGHMLPFVMDFGIAREQSAPGLTSTGMVIGTPYYMSPEHARGRHDCLDRRSDVYSLGVTLYEILGGQVPFKGDTPMETLLKIIEKDPVPLHKLNPRIPMDVETIVMKCMEKDPSRRYCSAKELADDIQRYLDGDPINARPATFTYRIKRKLVKHKWSAMVAGVASLVIIILLVLWLQAQHTAARRAEVAQQLGQEVEKIDSTIYYAHLLPLHDISAEKRIIRERIGRIKVKMKEVGDVAYGPGHYAMGRGYIALQEFDKARNHLEKAWESGYQQPEVAYELGKALGELYLNEAQKANRIDNKEIREARLKTIEKEFREPAVRFLQQGMNIPNESPVYIEALIAFYEKKFPVALAKLKEAEKDVSVEPSLKYRIKMLAGHIYLELGLEKSNAEAAMEFFNRAEAAYQEVVKMGQSDIRGYIGLTRVLERDIMLVIYGKGGDLKPLVARAIELCRQASSIDPGQAEIYVTLASVYDWQGFYEMVSGENPEAAFDLAIASGRKAIELQADNFGAYTIIGVVNRNKGQYRMEIGHDPAPEFESAIKHFQVAIKLNPTNVMAYNGIGNVYIRKAQYESSHGKDSIATLELAVATFEKALSINPELVNLHNGLAGALWFKGGVLMGYGRDPRPAYARAIQSLENAIKLNPSFSHFYTNLGFVYLDLAQYHLDYGLPPEIPVNNAVQYLEKAITINPRANEIHLGLVSVYGILIKYDYMQGKDSSVFLQKAEEYYEQGIDVNPRDIRLYIRMADNSIWQGRYLLSHGQSPSLMLEQAYRLLEKARSINPNYYEVYGLEGEIALLSARWNIKQKLDPRMDFTRASGALEKAIELNPRDIRLQLILAQFYWREATWYRSLKQVDNAVKSIDAGLAAIDKALAINSNFGETYALQGVLVQLKAGLLQPGKTDRNLNSQASGLFRKAISINRNLEYLYTRFTKQHLN